MEIEITKQEDRALVGRKDVVAHISFDGATPSKKEVVAAVAKALSTKPELVIVRGITTEYGSTTGTVEACVYKDRKMLEGIEHASMVKKHEFKAEQSEPAPEQPGAEEPAAGEPEATKEGDA